MKYYYLQKCFSRHKVALTIVTILIIFATTSCTYKYNYDGSSSCPGIFVKGSIYLTSMDMFLVKPYSKVYRDYHTKKLVVERNIPVVAVTTEGDYDKSARLFSAPKSISSYLNDPVKSSMIDIYSAIHVVGVLEKGTKIVVSKVEKGIGFDLWFGAGSYITNYGAILSGRYAGQEVLIDDLGQLFNCPDGEVMLRPDPVLLLKSHENEH